MKVRVIFLAALLFCFGCSNEIEKSLQRFPERSVTVGSENYRYRVYVPAGRSVETRLPVMLFLHGSANRGSDNEANLSEFPLLISQNTNPYNFIIVFPQCPSEKYWTGPVLDAAIAALDKSIEEFSGDPDRISVVGYSMGGFGAWQAAVNYPGKFAAVVPISGGISSQETLPPALHVAIDGRPANDSREDRDRFVTGKVGAASVWIFHGAADDTVSPVDSRIMFRELKALGTSDVHYTEYEGAGHDILRRAMSEPSLLEWLARTRRKNL